MTGEEERFAAAVDEHVRRAGTVHERVACPACCAPAGTRCVRRDTSLADTLRAPALKHPHSERLAADGIYLR